MALVLWLAFAMLYPWLERVVDLDAAGVRAWSWWSDWLNRRPNTVSAIKWSAPMVLTVHLELFLSLTGGSRRLWLWAGVWPKRELWTFVSALRERNVAVRFGRLMSEFDDERRAVVWRFRQRLLIPTIRRTPDGRLVETAPVAVLRPGGVGRLERLLDEQLAMTLTKPGRHREADAEYLAELADTDIDAFEAEGRRLSVGGYRSGWSIRVEGRPAAWLTDREVDRGELALGVLEILGFAVEQPLEDQRADESDGEPASELEPSAD
jgi:hypothetical protein